MRGSASGEGSRVREEPAPRFRVSGLGFGVQGLELELWGLGFRVEGLGFQV